MAMKVQSARNPEDISLDGRVFVGVTNAESGEVGPLTTFTYCQDGDVIWADYSGGQILRGFLVGTRNGKRLHFRYAHLGADRQTATGVCDSVLEVLADSRLRFHESWVWESRSGAGTSIVEEVHDGADHNM